ncbi:DUF2382 domain-containing protein (plasmid) [Streptosporangium sp. CA-135522]|uniref:DUF2382 domain-containing protein n=1 Tax=Streptosporangium sp. CA-135522 TaxID=3240072 RepID=UPI003D931F1C
MITQEQIPMVIDQPVYDTHGDKVGKIKHVYLDDASGQPEWLCVQTGLFGTKETFVPIQGADVVADHVEVAFDKDRIKDAPTIDVEAGGHMSAQEEQELYRYYNIDWEASWQQANQPDQGGWAHTGGQRERERMDRISEQPDGESMDRTGDDAMTRSEEQLKVGTETRESGRARLRKYVVTEEEQVTVPVSHEEVRLEREPITDANREAALGGPDITEAEHEVILHEQRPVVETETIPVEQVRMTKEQVTDEETVSEQVRKERIEAEGDTGESGRTS